jgi:hypothetical protein
MLAEAPNGKVEMAPQQRPRNPLVIRSAGIDGVYVIKLDPSRLEDQWRVTVYLQDLKDAIEDYEQRCPRA